VVTLLVVGIFFIIGIPFDASYIDSRSNPALVAASASVAMQDIVQGSGPAAKPGDTVVVNYTGKFQDGTVFDTSVGKDPFTFTIGAPNVIAGWNQGLVGAQAGTKRFLVVPPELGYGPKDYGPIPGNSTLIFEIDVLKVEPAGALQ
jgi:FKBP-type peptidyl-prolyl cis-trans isomerase